MHEEPAATDVSENDDRNDAVFMGWQATPSGEVFPLYNVIAECHPLKGSTVTDKTLREHHLAVPRTPPKK